MNATLHQQTVFHLTGRPPEAPLEPVGGRGLRPALMARYRDLGRLRYDFPVILVDPPPGGPFVRSLSDVVSALARDVAPEGPPGEALRKQLLAVERAVRQAVAGGASGGFLELWDQAVEGLGVDPKLAEILRHAAAGTGVDGEVADCDAGLPGRLLGHAWRVMQREKLGRVRQEINGLIVKLNDILRADFVRSEAGRRPETLKAALGGGQQALFDFDAMARMLSLGGPTSRLPASRRKRIEWALSVLRAQRFFPADGGAAAAPADEAPYEYRFDSCRAVKAAFAERLPEMAELVKAMAVAELEADGRYDEERHDAYFAGFGPDDLSPEDLARFPAYFACLEPRPAAPAADTNLMELLSSGIPVKVLVESDDLLEEGAPGQGRFAFGVRSVQLASLAVALDDAFVLQAASAHLVRMAERIRRGLAVAAPALFSVYAAGGSGEVPAYLVSAAAMQSRAFPAFTYDPSAGADLASRFCLESNPQAEWDWPLAPFEYADADLQRVAAELAFTLADFLLADRRYAGHFARVPHGDWNDRMVPLSEWLGTPQAANDNRVPYVLAVDGDNVLQRLVVDDKLVQAALKCLEHWHRLQELGGVHNSHARALLAREKAAWEEAKRREIEALAGAAVPADLPAEPAPAEAAAAATGEPVEEDEPARSPDEAWIETIRCSSCNECTQINGEMFAYNENQQAYIKDLKAGTYRQLVEAAESCQLSIIHPGKPWNPAEPGLEELVERAKPFV